MFHKQFHSLITSALILGLLSGGANAATFVWDGGENGNGKDDWSGTKGDKNWVGDSPPTSNNDLRFAGSLRTTNNNNISNLSILGIEFASGANAFTLDGSSLTFVTGTGILGIINSSSNLQTINMALGLNATISVSGGTGGTGGVTNGANIVIGGAISGTGGITKIDANTLFLNGVNTYTGVTTISAGSLGGTGTIAPSSGTNGITVSSGAIIAPGNANTTGTLTFNFTSTSGGLTMNSGSGFQFHLGTAGLSIGSVGMSDMLAIAGASSGDVIFNNNNINFLGTGSVGYYKIFDTSLDSTTWTGLTVNPTSGQITGGLTFSNLASGYSAIFIRGGGTLGGTTGDIFVQVIPEPSAVLLGGLGTVLLLLRRRRA